MQFMHHDMRQPGTTRGTYTSSVNRAPSSLVPLSPVSRSTPVMRCTTCNVKFESADLLAMHMLDHSYREESKRTPGSPYAADKRHNELRCDDKSSRQQYHALWQLRCDYCKQMFVDRDALAMHMISHTICEEFSHKVKKTETYPCTQCGLIFTYRDLLVMHLLSNHRSQTLFPLDLSKEQRLRSSADIGEPKHKRRCLTESPYVERRESHRDLAQEVSTRRERNDSTPLIHTRDIMSWVANGSKELYHCVHCDIIYKDKAIYYLHSGLHNRNNPWQCNICGKLCGSVLEFSAHIIHN